MGLINSLLPKKIKPISRNIGFYIKSLIYRFRRESFNTEKELIFILGNQKSGTSAIASLLGKYTNQKTSIDLFYSGFNYKVFEMWKKKELSTNSFVKKNNIEFASKIIKEPHLSVFYNELKKEFTDAKFIFIVRNPVDNIRSILDRLGIDGSLDKLNATELKKIFHSWNLVFNNQWLGLENGSFIENLAYRWNYITDIYLDNRDSVILVKYEDFLLDKEECIAKLAEKLNLEKVNSINDVLDYSFQPKGKSKSINKIDFFGKENLKIINSICKKGMNRLDYT